MNGILIISTQIYKSYEDIFYLRWCKEIRRSNNNRRIVGIVLGFSSAYDIFVNQMRVQEENRGEVSSCGEKHLQTSRRATQSAAIGGEGSDTRYLKQNRGCVTALRQAETENVTRSQWCRTGHSDTRGVWVTVMSQCVVWGCTFPRTDWKFAFFSGGGGCLKNIYYVAIRTIFEFYELLLFLYLKMDRCRQTL